MYWIEFFISSLLIIFSGVRLTKYADKVSDRFHLGKTWVGIIILGFVTSLPEAITSLASVVSLKANNLAVGNLLGSNNFNLILIVVMDFLYRRGSITNAIDLKKSHGVSAGFSILLLFFAFAQIKGNILIPLPLSLGSLLIAVFYLWGIRKLARLGKEEGLAEQDIITPKDVHLEVRRGSFKTVILNLVFSAALVIAGAIWLVNSAETISVKTGLGESFVGSIFLALVTSLPEMVVTTSAMKMGAFDLAVGNIFGSNMSNLFILFLCDLFKGGGSLLNDVSATHSQTAALGIVLSVIAFWGFKNKIKRIFFGLGIDSIFLAVVFLLGNLVIYRQIIFR